MKGKAKRRLRGMVATLDRVWKGAGFANPVWLDPVPKIELMGQEIQALREALAWASAASDFGPGGRAEKGWQEVAAPLLTTPRHPWVDHKTELKITEPKNIAAPLVNDPRVRFGRAPVGES